MIKIFVPTPLRKFTANQTTVAVQAGTIAEAIEQLAISFPELDQYLFEKDRSIRKFVRIFLGDEDIQSLQGILTPLKDGDEINIIPAIAGGLS